MKTLIDEEAATAAACMTEEEWNALPDRSRAAIARLTEDKAALLLALQVARNEFHHPGACYHERGQDIVDFIADYIEAATALATEGPGSCGHYTHGTAGGCEGCGQ